MKTTTDIPKKNLDCTPSDTAARRQETMLRCVLCTFCISGMSAQPLGSFIPFLRSAYGFGYGLSGALLSFQSVGNLIAVLIAGFLPLYFGRRRGILITGIWMPVAYLIFAAKIGTPAILILSFFMNGIARGGNSNFSNTVVSTLPDEKATHGFNLLHGMFAVGALASPLLLVLLSRILPADGWRLMAALICLATIIQNIIYLRMPLPPEPKAKSIRTADVSFFRNNLFWLSMLMLFCYISTEYAITGWMVTYFQDIGILSSDSSQMMNSLFWGSMFIGRMCGAVLSNRISRQKLLIADGIGCFVFFFMILFAKSAAFVTFGIFFIGLFMATVYPTAFAFGSESIRGNDLGASLLTLAGSAGGIITPALIGLAAEKSGIRTGMSLVVVFTSLQLASILLSARLTGKPRR